MDGQSKIRPRKGRDAWLRAGLRILETGGVHQLTIDAAAAKVGLTKGSFYHHFSGRANYQEAILELWDREMTRDVMRAVESEDTPHKKLRKLMELTSRRSNRHLEIQIRAWAQHDPVAHRFQERVDKDRTGYIAGILQSLGLSNEESKTLSQVYHAVFVGAQHVMPSIEGQALEALYALLQQHVDLVPIAKGESK